MYALFKTGLAGDADRPHREPHSPMISFAFDKSATQFPPESWDCHVHVFGDPVRFPFAHDRRYTPMRADIADLKRHLLFIGAGGAVIVQASPYGDDNSCLLDALEQLRGRTIGVVSLCEKAMRDDARLSDFDFRGVRGARLQLRYMQEPEAEQHLMALGQALQGSRWHVEINMRREQTPLVVAAAEKLSVPLVLDHFADHAIFNVHAASGTMLARAMATGRVWLKISAAHRVAGLTDPAGLARALAKAFPQRCVWGSDWPHTPPHGEGDARLRPSPFRTVSSAQAIDAPLCGLDRDTLHQILKVSPVALYGRSV